MSRFTDVETLRTILRDAARVLSPREMSALSPVGRRVSHGTIYSFVRDGSKQVPYRDTLDRLEELAGLDVVRAAAAQGSRSGNLTDLNTRGPELLRDDTPDLDDDQPGYWRGYLDASRDMLEAAHELAEQANAMVARATARIGRMVDAAPRWEYGTVRARLAKAAATAHPAELRQPASAGATDAREPSEAPPVDRLPETEEELRALALEALAARRTDRRRTGG